MRRICYILTFCLLFISCEKPVTTNTSIEVSQTGVLLAPESGSTATFTVTADGNWSVGYEGGGFSVSPRSGSKGTTNVEITATTANSGQTSVDLGGVTVNAGKTSKRVGVSQNPATAEQTVLMYMPWSGNLTSFFRQNIEDMEEVIAKGYAGTNRVLVFFMESSSSASLFELYYDNGKCERRTRKTYTTAPAFTTAAGIASILTDAKQAAPARRYAMTIGSHGMAWIPVTSSSAALLRSGVQREQEYWEHTVDGLPITRWFGGTSAAHQTEISTLAEGIIGAGMHMEFILFDDCYMSSIEVAYELRRVADHLIGSTSEIMAFGFPYALMGQHMLGTVNYEGICSAFHNFYTGYKDPYGTIGVTICSELETLADIVRRINIAYPAGIDEGQIGNIQRLDGYNPVRFFDMGDYIGHLCAASSLLTEFEAQMDRTVPPTYRKHTAKYYSANGSKTYDILTFSGVTTSDPSTSTSTSAKTQTAWWKATH